MPTPANPQTQQQNNNHLLYDAALLATPDINLFQPNWLQQHAHLQATSSGRGQSWFIEYENQHWVLRHYLRGGLIAKFNRHLYFSWHAEQTRAWKEWRLLLQMRALNLPVPRPVAARAYWPAGQLSGFYCADLLLETIPHCQTLSSLLQQQTLTDAIWCEIGRCIKKFHRHDIYHADLNANNILIDDKQKIYLIDFDRCRFTQNKKLLDTNLPRLQRSLLKLQKLHPVFNYTYAHWLTLSSAYADNTSS